MAEWIANRRLVISDDGSRVLGPDEPQSGRLLAPEGGAVSDADCRRYGLGPYVEGAAEGDAGGVVESSTAPEPEAGRGLTIVQPAERRGRRR